VLVEVLRQSVLIWYSVGILVLISSHQVPCSWSCCLDTCACHSLSLIPGQGGGWVIVSIRSKKFQRHRGSVLNFPSGQTSRRLRRELGTDETVEPRQRRCSVDRWQSPSVRYSAGILPATENDQCIVGPL